MPHTLTVAPLLDLDRVRVGLPAETKGGVLRGLLGLVARHPAVRDPERLAEAVHAREAVLSTGVGMGLALPHARTDAVSESVAAFAVMAEPVPFDAIDGEPVRLALLLAGPEAARREHVRLLGRVSRLMNRAAFRARLLAAPTPEAVLAAFHAEEPLLG